MLCLDLAWRHHKPRQKPAHLWHESPYEPMVVFPKAYYLPGKVYAHKERELPPTMVTTVKEPVLEIENISDPFIGMR